MEDKKNKGALVMLAKLPIMTNVSNDNSGWAKATLWLRKHEAICVSLLCHLYNKEEERAYNIH